MEKKVISLLGASSFLVIAGVALFLWSRFNPGSGPVAGGVIPLLLLLVGALGLNVGWVLHDVVERLARLGPTDDARGAPAKPENKTL